MAVAAAQYSAAATRAGARFVRERAPRRSTASTSSRSATDAADPRRSAFLHNLPGESTGVPASPVLGIDERASSTAASRIRDIQRDAASQARDDVLTVAVDASGDFSTYTLRLRTSITDDSPPAMFDPPLSAVRLLVQGRLPERLRLRRPDVLPARRCARPSRRSTTSPRTTTSFRQLMLDRLAALAPDWTERNPADLGVALVELLAYVGDQLSYYQDAVATEAYLGTARRRVSVRRHARLLDYRDARRLQRPGLGRLRRRLGQRRRRPGTRRRHRAPLARHTEQTTVAPADLPSAGGGTADHVRDDVPITLDAAHNAIGFYTWSDDQCCLPKGATACDTDRTTRPSPLPSATSSSSRRFAARRPASRPMQTRRTGTPSG